MSSDSKRKEVEKETESKSEEEYSKREKHTNFDSKLKFLSVFRKL